MATPMKRFIVRWYEGAGGMRETRHTSMNAARRAARRLLKQRPRLVYATVRDDYGFLFNVWSAK